MKKSIFQRALTALAAAALVLCVASTPAARQGGTARYIYDENGRLHAVITPSGEAVVYEYDAAGNVTAVRRLPADALAVFAFSPRAGAPGTLVTLVGIGFGAGVTGVSFNGAAARVVETTQSTLVAEVPQGATTGPITVTTATASAVTTTPFIVRGVRLTPSSARVLFGESLLFIASVVTDGDPSLIWSVNGVIGGNSSVGTITPDGLYTAPRNTGTAVIRAALAAEPDFYGEAQVTVRDPNDISELRAPGVSILRGLNDHTAPAAGPVAVQYGFQQGALVASTVAVSVQHGNADGVNSARAAGVTVQYGFGGQSPPLAPPVSVAYSSPDSQTTASASVSTMTGPHVASVSPAAVARSTTVTLTLTGANLTGATAVRLIDAVSGSVNTSITVTNISVSADGQTLTATLTVPNVAVGRYVVVVLAAAGDSATTETALNVIQIN